MSNPHELADRIARFEQLTPADWQAVVRHLRQAPGSPGKRTPQTVARLLERDRLLLNCASRFFGHHLTLSTAAEDISTAWRRYYSTAFHRERGEPACPAARIGKLGELFWSLSKLSNPLSARRIREIIGDKLSAIRRHDTVSIIELEVL